MNFKIQNPKFLFILAIIFCGIFGLVSYSQASTYYVKNGGDDSLSGLDDANAWAHCPGLSDWTGTATLTSGDIIYFRSQDTWSPSTFVRILTTRVSGVTYDGATYGSGTRARFLAVRDLISGTSGMVSIEHSNTTFKGIEIDGADTFNTGITMESATTNIANLVFDNIDVHNILEVTNVSGHWGYGINIASKAGTGGRILNGINSTSSSPKVSTSSHNFTSADIGKELVIQNGYYFNTHYATNIFSAAATIEPAQVYFDTAPGTKVASLGEVNSLYAWHWNAGTIYVYSPSDNSPSVNYKINAVGSGYILGVYTIVGIDGTSAILDRPCGMADNLSEPLWWFNGITISNVSILNSTFHDCHHEAIALYQAWGYPTNKTDGVLVRNCQVYNNNTGVLIANETNNVTVEFSNIHDNSGGIYIRTTSVAFDNFYFKSPLNFVFKNNLIYRNTQSGASVNPVLIAPTTGSFYSNIFYDNGWATGNSDGYEVYLGAGSDSSFNFYNNTFYSINNPNTNIAGSLIMDYGSTSPDGMVVNFKNNLVYVDSEITQSTYRPIWDRWDILTHSNNLIYRASSPTAVHVLVNTGEAYDRTTETTWEPTAQNTDPQFAGGTLPTGFSGTYGTDMLPNTNYFSIAAGSALNNGATLGSPYDGNINTSGTANPITRLAGAYDIGAYEYQGADTTSPGAPSGLTVN